jgi:8-oxo-dGTP diphosphatase
MVLMAGPAGQVVRIRAGAVIVRNGAVLAVEYDDENGLHYNLPGGGLERGETLREGVQREVMEETSAEVDVGRLLLITEWKPRPFGSDEMRYELGMYFQCRLARGSEPRMPKTPDPNQIALRWIPLNALSGVPLLPRIANELLQALEHPHQVDPLFCH